MASSELPLLSGDDRGDARADPVRRGDRGVPSPSESVAVSSTSAVGLFERSPGSPSADPDVCAPTLRSSPECSESNEVPHSSTTTSSWRDADAIFPSNKSHVWARDEKSPQGREGQRKANSALLNIHHYRRVRRFSSSGPLQPTHRLINPG